MRPVTWHFRLEGDDLDVQALEDLFKEGANIRTLEGGRRYIVVELPFPSSEAPAALDAAQELLSKLNGIAQAVYGNHENVRIDAVSSGEAPNHPVRHIIMAASGIRMRTRFGIGGVVMSAGGAASSVPAQKSIGDRLLDAADQNEHFERAIYLYGSLPQDWRGLYMVLEAAEDGNGGEKGLIAKAWVGGSAIKDFKATANSFKALRLEARHGSVTKGIPQPRQTIEAAREMISTILKQWGKELSEAAA